jgi:hypothetical protein
MQKLFFIKQLILKICLCKQLLIYLSILIEGQFADAFIVKIQITANSIANKPQKPSRSTLGGVDVTV